MKQLITALVLSLSITTISTANPVITFKSPATHFTDKYAGGKDELLIVPNLKTGAASISFKAVKACKGMVIIFNEAGDIVLKQQVKMTAGKNKINLNNFTSLKEGNYTVCLNTCHKIYSTPFLFWK